MSGLANAVRSPRRGARMKVWQPGSSLVSQRKVQVDDWSWAATKRRLHRPLPPRAPLPAADRPRDRARSLAATAASLAPPVIDRPRRRRRPATATPAPLASLVVVFVAASMRRRRVLLRPDLLHGLDGRADARRPPQPPLPPPAAALARLLRAQPRRRADQPADERRRGARPARDRRRHLADPEHADARRSRGDPVRALLEARARDADGRPAR